MTKAYWTAVAAYLLPTFPLGYVWHLVAFHENYERLAIYRQEVLIPLGVSSMVIQALLFSWAYPRLFSTQKGRWLRSAAQFGCVFGLIAWSYTTLPVAAKYDMTSVPRFMVLETGFNLLQFLVVSPLIALAYRDAGPSRSSMAQS